MLDNLEIYIAFDFSKWNLRIFFILDSDEKEEEEVVKEVKVAEPIVRDDSWRKSAPVREWDKGKKGMVLQNY